MAPLRTIIAVIGPTGTGKTALGLAIAAHLRTEVISVDSLQCYKDGRIMTAAPTPAETERVKHHMVGYLAPDSEPGDEFVRRAVAVADGLHSKGKIPVLVGGSTSLMLPLLFVSGGHNQESSIDHAGRSVGRIRWNTLVIMLNAQNDESFGRRLDARVEDMLAMGMVKELRDLYSLQQEIIFNKNSSNRIEEDEVGSRGVWKCIGYKELYPFLVATHNTQMRTPSPRTQTYGNCGNANHVENVKEEQLRERLFRDGIELMKHNTQRYARFQRTWADSVLVPALRTEGMPLHRFEIPCASYDEVGEREGAFKNDRWVENVEGPALRLCEAWRAAAHSPHDTGSTGAVAAIGGMLKENNVKRKNMKGTEIGMLSGIVDFRPSTATG